jgi:ZIP family zinc transporter
METLRAEGGRNPGEAEIDNDFVATSVWSVAFNTILMAVASGFGAAPFFIVSHVNRKWLGIANALASGVMLAASFGLIGEGLEGVKSQPHTLVRLMGGMVLGLVFIIISQVYPQIPSGAFGSHFGECARLRPTPLIVPCTNTTLAMLVQRLVEGHEVSMGSLKGLDARKAVMVMGIMTLHAFSEGLGLLRHRTPKLTTNRSIARARARAFSRPRVSKL